MGTTDFEVHDRGAIARLTASQQWSLDEIKRLRKLVAAHERLNTSLMRKVEVQRKELKVQRRRWVKEG